MIRENPLAQNISISLQTISAAEAHLAEGHSLLDEQTSNKTKSLAYRAGTRRSTIFGTYFGLSF
jgi:hypothetical protein